MNRLLFFIAACVMSVMTWAATPFAPGNSTEGIGEVPSVLNSSIDFGKYTIAAPAGMLSQSQSENQFNSYLPGGGYSMMIFKGEGKPDNLKQIAGQAVQSMKLKPSGLKEITVSGMKGYTTTQLLDSNVITFALLQSSSEMLTIIIVEKESLQPIGEKAILSITKK